MLGLAPSAGKIVAGPIRRLPGANARDGEFHMDIEEQLQGDPPERSWPAEQAPERALAGSSRFPPDTTALVPSRPFLRVPLGSGSLAVLLALSWPAHVAADAPAVSVCDRTDAIQTAILAAVAVGDCADVTVADLEDVTALDLSGRSLATLRAGDFSDLVRVKTLDLSGNTLSELPQGVFDPLSLLRTLRLHDNSLTEVPADTLDRLLFLEELTLHGNLLGMLPEGRFHGLSRFAGVDLSGASTSPPADTVARLNAFLDDHEIASVEDFISALSPLHRERFVMVFDSAGLGADSISAEYPRVVSYGAGGEFLFAWLTDPDAPDEFRQSVEFLQQSKGATNWEAGVIDFSQQPRAFTNRSHARPAMARYASRCGATTSSPRRMKERAPSSRRRPTRTCMRRLPS